jgi:predicted N-acyltransferase
VSFRHARGRDISTQDWAFFYQCYERTYLEHGNRPYLHPTFFADMARDMPEHWLLFVAQREGRDIACSLIGLHDEPGQPKVAYGRYWGALERVDCLHFEACYYQPLSWCLTHGFERFEGGAQGEHKMARALLPVSTHSAHWLAHAGFAQAVEDFLQREGTGVSRYLEHLQERSPLRRT